MARTLLRVDEAPNEGSKRLRELLRTRSAATIARKIKRHASTVRRWARDDRTPDEASRDVMMAELGIDAGAWEVKCSGEGRA